MLNLQPTHFRCLNNFPSRFFFASFFSSSINYLYSPLPQTLQSLLQYHALIITSGNSNNIFIASKLISLYALFKKPHFSTDVFNSIPCKDTFLWNSIIKSHFSNGNYQQAFKFFLSMRLSATPLNDFTIPMAVSACAEMNFLKYGNYIHGLALKRGFFEKSSAVGSSFVYMYAKCGFIEDACVMFDEITLRDVVLWTALVVGCVQNGENEKGLEYLCKMIKVNKDNEKPNYRTIDGGLQACGNLGFLNKGRSLHGFVVKTGLMCCQVVQSSILAMYCKCNGDAKETYFAFCEVGAKDLFSWTSIIGVYARLGFITESLNMFWEMQVGGIYPDGVVISCLLLGFGNLMLVSKGKSFHALLLRRWYYLLLDQMVHNALLSMYCKFRLTTLAEKLFKRGYKWNKESYYTMVSSYSKLGMKTKCIELFREMQQFATGFDSNSFVSVISSCSKVGETRLGRSLHCYVIKHCIDDESNVSAINALIDMYGKSGNLTIARRIFQRAKKDIVSWNTLISLYTHSGHPSEALALFDTMKTQQNLKPNSATLVSILSACSQLASLEKGKGVHRYIMEERLELNVSLATALVDMYAKCGQLETSRDIFDSMEDKDIISFNAMISSYGTHGNAESAIMIFQQMEQSNVKPNSVTFLALLLACTHSGLVEEGKGIFDRMKYYSVKPDLKHFACMVDLLGRFGNLKEAEGLVESMPITPDGGVWGALLSACKIHNDIDMGIRMAKLAIESDPENDGYYVMLCNMYSSVGEWDEAENARKIMMERGVGKRAGWSAV